MSSYTPTLNALLAPLPTATPDFKTVITIQPEAPGCSTLHYTRKELLAIKSIVPEKNLTILGVEDMPASVENVLLHLSDAYIAHFACHGQQSMTHPIESGLILNSGAKLKISLLMEKPMPKASLVFLSACDTAMGDKSLPDEALHLAASMLFAGFRGAVATMW